MASLASLIDKHGLTKVEADKLRGYAKAYRDEGYTGREANIEAVKDFLTDLEDERADILAQIDRVL
jgi:hypothetical protein